jgi:hypothetical protein
VVVGKSFIEEVVLGNNKWVEGGMGKSSCQHDDYVFTNRAMGSFGELVTVQGFHFMI